MLYVMRAYGRGAPLSGKRKVTEIRLRAAAPHLAVEEARDEWDRHATARRWRGYSVFDGRGRLVQYVPADEPQADACCA
jgi:hypothetical protein